MSLLNKIFISLFVTTLFIFSSQANANLTGSATMNSDGVKIEWNSILGVDLFRIDYGFTSGEYNKNVDFLEGTSYTFKELESNKTYYFSLIGYDEFGNEAYFSPEFSIINTSTKTATPLFVGESIMISPNEVELSFSNKLIDSNGRDFLVESLSNSNDFYEVLESKIDKDDSKKLIITLDGNPIVGEKYRVVVLSIMDEFNQNIQFGVDSETTFTGTDVFEEEEEELVLNSAADEEVIQNNNQGGSKAGVELDSSEIDSNLLKVAQENEKLPQTGPTELLLFLIALFAGLFIFMYKFKKA